MTYTATATDIVDGPVAPTCSPASGTSFPFGTTTVQCTATDARANSATGSFTVNVQDSTAPTITWSGNQGTYAGDQLITITCLATDSGSGVASSTCANVSAPASSFPLGSTTLTASAVDHAGNTGSGSTTFTVIVTPDSLCALVNRYVTKSGVANSLCVKVRNAAQAAARGDKTGANSDLVNFQNEVAAQTGKSISPADAETLVRHARALAASW